MSKHLNFVTFKKLSLQNPKVKAEYDKLQPEFAMINAIVKARKNNGLTQAQLAKKIGTKQSVISRLEVGNANPTVEFLKKLALALNSKLEISLS